MARSSQIRLWSLPLLLTTLLVLTTPTLAQNGNGGNGGQVEPDFSFYPENAHRCLYQSSNSTDCDRPNYDVLNECLCTNTRNFITDAARCLGAQGADNLDDIYNTLSEACQNSDTPTNVQRPQWLGAAEDGADSASTTTGGPSSTATDEPTSTNSSPPEETSSSDDGGDGGGGLGTGAYVGIAVGSAVAGMVLMSAFGFWLFRRYRKRHAAESSPMLPNSEVEHGTPMYTAASPFTDSKSPQPPNTVSPPVYAGAWGSPGQQAYGGHYAPAELGPEQTRGQAMEMEGSTHFNQAPVEMPGSTPGFTSQQR